LDEKKITLERFQILKCIDEISRKNGFGVAPIKDLINIFTSQRNIKSIGVRKMVWLLNKKGYLESPLRGCWRLSEKGKKVLDKVEGVV
jgi:hypothetical protein